MVLQIIYTAIILVVAVVLWVIVYQMRKQRKSQN